MGIMQVRLPEPIYITTNFKAYLTQIKDNDLANKLQSKIIKPEINYLDLEPKDKDVMLSYLDAKRLAKDVSYDKFKSPLRQEGKVGKVLRKLFPTLDDNAVRPFVETLHGLVKADEVQCYMVEGENIRHVYQWPRKYCSASTLQTSCFQGIVIDKYMELFVRNPDKIKCAVAMKNRMLAGRALVYYGKDTNGPCWYTSNLNSDCKTRVLLQKFIDNYAHGIPKSLGYQFRCEDLVDGTPLHHFSMSYSHVKDKGVLTPGDTWLGNDKWYNNPDSPDNASYSVYKKPAGDIVVPEDLASEGLTQFWP